MRLRRNAAEPRVVTPTRLEPTGTGQANAPGQAAWRRAPGSRYREGFCERRDVAGVEELTFGAPRRAHARRGRRGRRTTIVGRRLVLAARGGACGFADGLDLGVRRARREARDQAAAPATAADRAGEDLDAVIALRRQAAAVRLFWPKLARDFLEQKRVVRRRTAAASRAAAAASAFAAADARRP